MDQKQPEFSTREAELFQQRISWGLESEGILDRSRVPSEEITRNIKKLIDKVCGPQSEMMAFSKADLPRWHRVIFRDVGGPVGRFRSEHDGKIGFAVMVLDEAKDALVPLRVETCPAPLISDSLDAVFAVYAEKISNSAAEKCVAAAELWKDVILIHPFADGNTRTSLVLLQAALHQLGRRHFLTSAEDWEFSTARSYALRPDSKQSIEPLANLIEYRTKPRP